MCFSIMFYKLSDNDIHGIKDCMLCLLFHLLNFVCFLEYERVRKKEIDHILEALNREKEKCCELVRFKEKGIVEHQESFDNIFEILALGFEESSDTIAERIMEELIMVKTFTDFLSY